LDPAGELFLYSSAYPIILSEKNRQAYLYIIQADVDFFPAINGQRKEEQMQHVGTYDCQFPFTGILFPA
jgi:hypothetical protein